jgi:hypothetical protein
MLMLILAWDGSASSLVGRRQRKTTDFKANDNVRLKYSDVVGYGRDSLPIALSPTRRKSDSPSALIDEKLTSRVNRRRLIQSRWGAHTMRRCLVSISSIDAALS